MNIDNFLSLLHNVKKRGAGWSAKCPSHQDKHNSLSITQTQDEKILIKCFAGCSTEEILKSLNLTWQDLFPKVQNKSNFNSKITVLSLAQDKGLPEDFLLSLGVEQKQSYLRVSYFLENETLAPRQRKRSALSAKQGSFWEKGAGKPVPYGLWKLSEAKKTGHLVLVEGESDCWTLWFHNYPCLGLPGADMAKKLIQEHLESISKLYIVKEPDKGGETFLNGIRKRLNELNWSGIAFVIEMQKYKDPNELHQKSYHFKKEFNALIDKAKPISLTEASITVDYGELIPTLPPPTNKTVLELMQKAANFRHFGILAPQGSGKSYANAHVAVSQLLKGRSVIIFSRSHDELNQIGKTIQMLLRQKGLPKYHFFHLKGANQTTVPIDIPSVKPIIVVAPHVYLKFKGETLYHHSIIDFIIKEQFGKNPLVLIDEITSFIEMSFLSKMLGSRESHKQIFSKKIWIKNSLCPLFTKSSNCLNCKGNVFLVLRKHFLCN